MSPSDSAFDEDKYNDLMDGLECSEVLFSELDFSNRLDSEYYKKINIEYQNSIEKVKHKRLKEISDFLIGPFGSAYNTDNYVDKSEYRYVRGQDVKPFVLQNTSPRYIAQEDFERLKRYSLKSGDILVSVVGTIGNACIVQEKDIPAIFSCKSTVIRTRNVNPYFLISYLNSKYGKRMLLRQERGAIQKGLNLDDLKIINVPIFSDELQNKFQKILKRVEAMQDKSKNSYNDAETILMNEMGIGETEFLNGGVSIKSFKECFIIENRIDSEFFQPKYDKIIETITNYDRDAKSINDIAEYVFTGEYADEYLEFRPGLRHYVRGTDIHDGRIDIDYKYSVDEKGHYKFLSCGDIVTGRVGTIGNFGVVTDELGQSLCSDNVLCFHLPPNYLPNVYALYFNSKIVKELTNRMSRGSVQQRLNQETLRDLLVPHIDWNTQKQIDGKIKSSFLLADKAESLLKLAIHAVEMAIEQGEDFAVEWLDDILDKYSESE